MNHVNEEIVLELCLFAIHVRRLGELEGLKDRTFELRAEALSAPANGAPEVEADFWHAINKIMHYQRYTAQWKEAGAAYGSHPIERDYIVAIAVTLETDFEQHGNKSISVYELADAFFREIVPAVQKRKD
jgi:hypothetical protein